MVLAGLAMTWPVGLSAIGWLAQVGGDFFNRLDRLDIYRSSLTLLDDVGLIGLGPGDQYAVPFAKFALLIQVPFVTYPHQLPLHLWLAYGVAGVALFTAWIGG